MTAKDKAKNLVDKFSNFSKETRYGKENTFSKQCALIAIDEIVLNNSEFMDGIKYHEELNYWEEVKSEIDNL